MSCSNHTVDVEQLMNDDGELQDDRYPVGCAVSDGETVILEIHDGEPHIAYTQDSVGDDDLENYESMGNSPDSRLVRGTFDRDNAVVHDLVAL